MRRIGMPVIATVLRSGGEFTSDHVAYLACQLEQVISIPYQFVCLTDMNFHHPKILTIKLKNNWPGWWSKIELFRFRGFVISFDLDTMFYSNIDSLLRVVWSSSSFFLLKSFRPPTRGLSGMMGWNGDYTRLYEQFDFKKDSQKFRSEGDQGYIWNQLRNCSTYFIQDHLPGVYSWKRNCNQKEIPENCRILVFHGKPRPWEVPHLWNPVVEKYKKAVCHA